MKLQLPKRIKKTVPEGPRPLPAHPESIPNILPHIWPQTPRGTQLTKRHQPSTPESSLTQRIPSLRYSSALSLIEFLVWMAIISTTAYAAIPILAEGRTSPLDVMAQRTESIIRRTALSSSTHSVELKLQITSAAILVVSNAGKTVDRLTSLKEIYFHSDRESILFYGNGLNSPSSIAITFKDRHCVVVISLFGRVRSVCR